MSRQVYHFAGYSLDLARYSLWGPSGEIGLRPKSFEVLRFLVSRGGNVVTKDELIQGVWSDVTVTDESVTRCISEIRHALGDAEQRIVRTVPRRGYLVDVPVEESARHAPPSLRDDSAGHLQGLAGAHPRGWRGGAASSPAAAPTLKTPVVRHQGGGPERRLLTILSCSLVDAAAYATRLDPEDLQDLTREFHDAVRAAIEQHGGLLARPLADGAIGYFGYPTAREEDAERAVHAALAAVKAVSALRPEFAPSGLQAQIGIATGLVVVGDVSVGGTLAGHALAGEAPLLAERLSSVASAGTIVISPGTRRQLGDLFEYRTLIVNDAPRRPELEGASVVLRESDITNRFDALRRSGNAPLVGRAEELDTLLRHWNQAASVSGRVVQIFGEAGIGKSRLAHALLEKLADEPHTRLRYYCSPNYTDSALQPIISQLATAAGIDRSADPQQNLARLERLLDGANQSVSEIVPLLATLLSIPLGPGYAPPPPNPQRRKERTFNALIRQLVAIGTKQPVLMVFEDVHWMDPTSLELLGLLIDKVPELPVLLMITARPEFTPPWPQHAHVSVLQLGRLGLRDGDSLAQSVVDGRQLPRELLREINEHTDGIPLFIEELTKTIIESGVLKIEGGQYVLTQAVPALSIPSTLHASLLSRLDRLGPTKTIAQIASAIGREFSHGLIATVAGLPEAELRVALDRLVSAGLVFRRGLPPDANYFFKHALLRDAAYESLLRSHRRTLHETIAARLVEQAGADERVKPELIAHHCAEAGLAEAAIGHYLTAGSEAVARSALSESSILFEKAIAQVWQLPEGRGRDARELEVQSARGASLIAVRGYGAAETGRTYARAKELWDRLGKPLAIVHVVRGLWLYHLNHRAYDKAQALAEEVLALGRKNNDLEGQILSMHCLGAIAMFRGKLTEGRAIIEEAHERYDANAHRELFKGLPGYDPNVLGLSLLAWGLSLLGLAEQALERSAESLRRARRSGRAPDLASSLEVRQKQPTLSDADFSAGYAELQELADQHGFPYWVAEAHIVRGELELRRGNAAEAVSILPLGREAQSAAGGSFWRGHYAIQLAAALEQSGRQREALEIVEQEIDAAERADDRWYLPELYRRRGLLHLTAGADDTKRGTADLQKALDIAREQDAKLWELRAATSMARHLRDQGLSVDARQLLQPVLDWFTEGLECADVACARDLLAELRS